MSVLLVLPLGVCTGVDRGPTPPKTESGGVEAAPGDGAAPESRPRGDETGPAPAVAKPPTNAPLEPPRLRVAFEGRCDALRASVIDDQVLVHLTKEGLGPTGYGRQMKIYHVAADATIGEALPDPPPNTATQDAMLSGIFSLAGRWPDQVYASIWYGSRGDYGTGMIRFDGQAWSAVHPLGDNDVVSGVLKWHQRSIVAIACAGDCTTTKMPVIRGAPKGPRTDKLRQALGCEGVDILDAAAIETGDLVAIARCGEGDLYAGRWKPDDLAGEVKRLYAPGAERPSYHLEHDGKDTFWIAAAGKGRDRLFRSAPGKWDEVEPPAGSALVDLAIDVRGAPWVLRADRLWRREADAWVAEDVQVGAMRQLVGVEQGTPWVIGEALARGGSAGTWHRAEVPPSAFFPDRRLKIEGVEVDRAGDVWLTAEFTVIRRDKKAPVGRFYRSVVTSRKVAQPLRCGEVVSDRELESFGPWPVGPDASCQKRLVLLLEQDHWKPNNTYPSYGKALRGATDVGAPRFLELEISGVQMLGAIVDGAAEAEALIARARKAQRWKFPETVCGDEAELARVGVKIHRELAADLAAGALVEKTTP